MTKFIGLISMIIMLRYVSFLNSDISFLFKPLQYVAEQVNHSLNESLGSSEIANSLFGKLYMFVIIYTLTRLLIYVGFLKIVNYGVKIIKKIGFSDFESYIFILRIIFGQVDCILFIGNRIKSLTTKELHILCLSLFNSVSLSALAVYFVLFPEFILYLFISHILGVIFGILIPNLMYRNENDSKIVLENPYNDKGLIDCVCNGINQGSVVMLSFISPVIGLHALLSIVANMFVFNNIPTILLQLGTAVFTDEIIFADKFALNKNLAIMFVNFNNLPFLVFMMSLLNSVGNDERINKIAPKCFIISIFCNFLKVIVMWKII